MYTTRNFKTKKALKEAVAAWNTFASVEQGSVKPWDPKPVTYYQPGPFGGNEPRNGAFSVEGPHYPEPHRWYARCRAQDGVIVEVK